ncbi:universal stress protein [Nocardioides aquiterrae]|uniref:Universal stress protein n=1 Tax=Nocardioides aquiterrae TaxID=203799 RepID=A0ABN1UEX8_9ACTN
MTTTPRTVVVGVDGSEGADAALAWAARHAQLAGADLELVHAVALPSMAGIGWSVDASLEAGRLQRALEVEGEKAVTRARRSMLDRHPQLTIRSEVVTGDPREVLLDRGAAAYLLVVGSHGRGPVRSLLVGSVGAALARHATTPTVVVRGSTGGTGGVVAGVESAACAAPVLEFAFEYAELHGLRVTALRSVPDGIAGTIPTRLPEPDGQDVAAARAMLAEATGPVAARHPDVRLHLEVARGRPAEGLLRHADGASLVVVGTSRHHVGNDAVATVEHAACPVAVVPVQEPEPRERS